MTILVLKLELYRKAFRQLEQMYVQTSKGAFREQTSEEERVVQQDMMQLGWLE